MSLGEKIREHYQTYFDFSKGRHERQLGRIILQALSAITLALLLPSFSDTLVSVCITAIAILTGFSFSSLFPIAMEATRGLSDPRFSEDRHNLDQLKLLSTNFRANISFFVPLCLLNIVVFCMIAMEFFRVGDFFSFGSLVSQPSSVLGFDLSKAISSLPSTSKAFEYLLKAVAISLFVEALYTFYRISLGVSYILKIRENYNSAG